VMKEHFSGEHQRYFEMPRGAHNSIGSIVTNSGVSCGSSLALQFLAEPAQPLDASCLDDIAPISFDGPAELSKLTFGVEDPWGDP
jgi:hypothetical protein